MSRLIDHRLNSCIHSQKPLDFPKLRKAIALPNFMIPSNLFPSILIK
jgi:hypothetical protein